MNLEFTPEEQAFRDEAIDLASGQLKRQAQEMAPHCLLFDEFIAREAAAGRIA